MSEECEEWCKEVSMSSIQSGQREGEKEVGTKRGMERGTVGGLEEMKEEMEKKGETTGSLCCCHYNHSLISLYSVTISCYGNTIISILQVAEILSEATNSLQSASSIHPILRRHNHVHMSPPTFVCVHVHVHK